jgi:hypothetical protein
MREINFLLILDFLHNPKRGSEIAFVGYGKI